MEQSLRSHGLKNLKLSLKYFTAKAFCEQKDGRSLPACSNSLLSYLDLCMFHYLKTLSLGEDIQNSSGDSRSGSFFHRWHTRGCHSWGTGRGVYRHRFHRYISAMAGRRPCHRRVACIFAVSTSAPPDPPEADLMLACAVKRE